MKRLIFYSILIYISGLPLFSQPGAGKGFSLTRNIKYNIKGDTSLCLDLYTPGGQSMSAGIGVAGKDPKQKLPENVQVVKVPVIIWLPEPGKRIFPTPVAGLVGNGYAIASVQNIGGKKISKNIGRAVKFLSDNASKNNIDLDTFGIIRQTNKGYSLEIFTTGNQKTVNVISSGPDSIIEAINDSNFSILQSSENFGMVISFFDKYLAKGNHIESDPLAIKCPVDSWIDPITNPIPLTTYRLFPTPSRGKGTEGSYLIYLPEGYSNSKNRYPVIYWLHGGNGNSREGAWMCKKMVESMQKGDMPHCIVVFVQGLPIGWYNNSVDGEMPVEDVIIKDLIPHIDGNYRTLNKREGRGIDGMSMGGYGSLHLAFKYPELFGIVSSIAPSITTYEMERKEVILPTFGNDTAFFNHNSPSKLIDLNRDKVKGKTTIRLLIGDKDFLYDLLEKFHFQLQELGIDHYYSVVKGAGHDYREVINNLEGNSFTFWKEAFRNAR